MTISAASARTMAAHRDSLITRTFVNIAKAIEEGDTYTTVRIHDTKYTETASVALELTEAGYEISYLDRSGDIFEASISVGEIETMHYIRIEF